MNLNSKNRIGIGIGVFILLCVFVFGGIALTRNVGKSQKEVSKESAVDKMNAMYKKIKPSKGTPKKSPVEPSVADTTDVELPDISSCEVVVEPTTDYYAEVWSSPEKAGSGTDGWLTEMAEAYNKQNRTVDGQSASIKLRNVNSGQSVDYIVTGKAIPDGLTPSSMIWIEMLKARGVKPVVISESMVGNVAGIVFEKEKYKEFSDKYGGTDLKDIISAVESGELMFGYTNPFGSTGGMNLLISTLNRYDSTNPLSDTAVKGFSGFQKNVPFVALTTIQMRDAAEKGSLDTFVSEYQTYVNDKFLKKNYEFIPYGYRHDNPLTALESTSDDKQLILKDFAEFCQSEGAKELANKYGFNGMPDYVCDMPDLDGKVLIQAQKLYKENKDNGKTIVAVFVTDVSGSMEGDRIMRLKESLINGMKYISPDNYIGLVSYSHDVTEDLKIDKFTLEQQSLFKGAVEGLDTLDSTAIYDGLIVGCKLIYDKMAELTKEDPSLEGNLKPMLFLLSDGDNCDGYSFNDVSGVIAGLKYPVYTIGYDANLDALAKISSINEAASINADTDDIVYQLKMLFEASM